VYDVNSLYPYIMHSTLLPFGVPIYSDEIVSRDDYPLWIGSFTITATLKPNHIPCIQIKGNPEYSATAYQLDLPEPVTVAVTNVDWDLWNEHYDIEVHEVHGAYYFTGAEGLFTEYIDKWSAVKANSKGGKRLIAKLMLNSLYGKFGTNPNVTPKVPVWDDERDMVKLTVGTDEQRKPIYTAMACFITAYARAYTIRAAQRHYARFLYADTDSLHLSGWEEPDLEVDPDVLGAWKHEHDFTDAIFLRAKAYSERIVTRTPFFTVAQVLNGNLETHVAGMPESIAHRVRFSDYVNRTEFQGKLQTTRVPGGVVLANTTYTLK
jgi:hypothetical protein